MEIEAECDINSLHFGIISLCLIISRVQITPKYSVVKAKYDYFMWLLEDVTFESLLCENFQHICLFGFVPLRR